MIRRLAAAVLVALAIPSGISAQGSAVPTRAQPGAAETSHPPGVSSPAPTGATLDPAREETVRRLASELRCPVCQGLSVQDSPTELSQQMKAASCGAWQQMIVVSTGRPSQYAEYC